LLDTRDLHSLAAMPPTTDPEEGTLDFTVPVVGERSEVLAFLQYVGGKYAIDPDRVADDPSVALSLGESTPRFVFHLSAYECDRVRADGAILVVGPDGPTGVDAAAVDACDDDVPAHVADVVRFAAASRAELPELPPRLAHASTIRGDVRSGAGVFDVIKAVTKAMLERTRGSSAEHPKLPQCVREGLHRHDRASPPALSPDGAPAAGAHVKLQINLREPLETKAGSEEYTTWLAMGGEVVAVEGADAASAVLTATSSMAPPEFEGTWRAELVRQRGWTYPWILRSLVRVPD